MERLYEKSKDEEGNVLRVEFCCIGVMLFARACSCLIEEWCWALGIKIMSRYYSVCSIPFRMNFFVFHSPLMFG